MPSANISILTLTVAAAGALAAGRCINQAGSYPAAGARAFGVTRSSAAAAGDLVPVDVLGTAIAEAGGTFAQDDALMVDATGRVVLLAGLSKTPVACAMEAGTVGAMVEVLLVPGAGLTTPAA